MKVALLSVTVSRKDPSKIIKREILSVEEVDEDEYWAPLVDSAWEGLKAYLQLK